jgi:hypothetical protein
MPRGNILKDAAGGTSHEEGDVGSGTGSNIVGGMYILVFITYY